MWGAPEMANPLKPTAIVRKKMDRKVVLLNASSSRKNASSPKPASFYIAYYLSLKWRLDKSRREENTRTSETRTEVGNNTSAVEEFTHSSCRENASFAQSVREMAADRHNERHHCVRQRREDAALFEVNEITRNSTVYSSTMRGSLQKRI